LHLRVAERDAETAMEYYRIEKKMAKDFGLKPLYERSDITEAKSIADEMVD